MKRLGILLVAGKGSRFRAYEDALPKCLAKIDELCILDEMIFNMHYAGIHDILLVTGYNHMSILKHIAKTHYGPEIKIHCIFNKEWEYTNNMMSLKQGLWWAYTQKNKYNEIIFSNGDNYINEFALRSFVDRSQPTCLLVNDYGVEDPEQMKCYINDYGDFYMLSKDKQLGRVLGEFTGIGKINCYDVSNIIFNILTYVFKNGANDWMEKAFNLSRWNLFVISDSTFKEIDTQKDLVDVRELLEK